MRQIRRIVLEIAKKELMDRSLEEKREILDCFIRNRIIGEVDIKTI